MHPSSLLSFRKFFSLVPTGFVLALTLFICLISWSSDVEAAKKTKKKKAATPATSTTEAAAAQPKVKYEVGEDPEFAKRSGWPVQMPPTPEGAILPGKRIVAYYGNPQSKKMGVLGEYPKDEMLQKLKGRSGPLGKGRPVDAGAARPAPGGGGGPGRAG